MVKKQVMLAVLGILVIWGNQRTFSLTVLDPSFQAETYVSYDFELGNHPAGDMTFDPQGNLYIVQYENYESYDGRIYRVDTNKTVSTLATGLTRPEDIVWGGGTDFGDYLYVTEGFDNAYNNEGGVTQVGLDGSINRFVTSGFDQPVTLGVDRVGNYDGNMYVGSSNSDRINKVLPDGQVQGFYSFGKKSGTPVDIEFSPNGSYGGLMYVATQYVSYPEISGILTFDTLGNPTKIAPDIEKAYDLAFDGTETGVFGNYLYAVVKQGDDYGSSIYRIYPDGQAELFISDLWWQTKLAFGPDGALYVSESHWGNSTVTITRVESYAMLAIQSINEALEFKQQALDKIEQALEKEQAAIQALNQLKHCESGNLGPVAITKTKVRIKLSMIFERIAKHQIRKSMASLRTALSILAGSDHTPDPPNEEEMELLEEEEIRRSDINQDGIVNTLDYAILMKHWLKSNE